MTAVPFRDVKGTPVPTPWVGRYWNYERMSGVMVPRHGEVAWVLPGGRTPYWRGTIVSAEFEY